MTLSTSVVLSLYNPNPSFLEQQLDSIASQTLSPAEIIVYNDNPLDVNRGEFVRKRAPGIPVRYIHGTRNLGYTKAFEKLVSLAGSDLIAFCDQDDVWEPERLATATRVFEDDARVSLVTCDRFIINETGMVTCASFRTAHPSPETTWHTGDNITVHAASTCYAIGMATMVRSDVAKSLTPFPAHTAHDLWLTLGASELGICAYVEKPLVRYRRWGSNASGTLKGIEQKSDWYNIRVAARLETALAFEQRFPESEHAKTIVEFAKARANRNLLKAVQDAHRLPPPLQSSTLR